MHVEIEASPILGRSLDFAPFVPAHTFSRTIKEPDYELALDPMKTITTWEKNPYCKCP